MLRLPRLGVPRPGLKLIRLPQERGGALHQGRARPWHRAVVAGRLWLKSHMASALAAALGAVALVRFRLDDLREAIEAMRDDLRSNNLKEAKRKLDQVVFYGEYRACRECYGPRHGHG